MNKQIQSLSKTVKSSGHREENHVVWLKVRNGDEHYLSQVWNCCIIIVYTGRIQFIKSGSNDIYNLRKVFFQINTVLLICSSKNIVLLNFIFSKIQFSTMIIIEMFDNIIKLSLLRVINFSQVIGHIEFNIDKIGCEGQTNDMHSINFLMLSYCHRSARLPHQPITTHTLTWVLMERTCTPSAPHHQAPY